MRRRIGCVLVLLVLFVPVLGLAGWLSGALWTGVAAGAAVAVVLGFAVRVSGPPRWYQEVLGAWPLCREYDANLRQGRPDEARAVLEELVRICEAGKRERPLEIAPTRSVRVTIAGDGGVIPRGLGPDGAMLATFVGVLNEVGIRCYDADRYPEALTLVGESIQIYDILRRRSAAYLPLLASVHARRSNVYGATDRLVEAVADSRIAIGLFAEAGAGDDRSPYLGWYVLASHDHVTRLIRLGRREDLAAATAAHLALVRRPSLLDEHVEALALHYDALTGLERFEEALPVAEERVALWRAVVTPEPAPWLAEALDDLAVVLTALDRPADAEAARAEAAGLRAE